MYGKIVRMSDTKPKIQKRKRPPGRPPKGEKLTQYSIRLPAKLLEKLNWRAAEQGVDVQDVIRSILSDALAHQKPPVAQERREISASLEEWERYRDLCDALGAEDVSAIVIPLLNRLYAKQFPA